MLQLTRLLKIIGAVARYRLDNLVDLERMPFLARCFIRLLPWRYIIHNDDPRGGSLEAVSGSTGSHLY